MDADMKVDMKVDMDKEQQQISAGTIARTAALLLALVNQLLTVAGHSPIPLAEEQLQQLAASCATVIAAVWSWWENNSFTKNALAADACLQALNRGEAVRIGSAAGQGR